MALIESKFLDTNTKRDSFLFSRPRFPSQHNMLVKFGFGFLVSFFFLFGAVTAIDPAPKKGPKITSVVYFDIEHGGKPLGRSQFLGTLFVSEVSYEWD